MTQEEILDGLKDIFKQVKPQLDTTNVTREASLINDLGIDSLSLLLLSLAIEQKFDFKFNSAQAFQTVGEVVDYIAEQTK